MNAGVIMALLAGGSVVLNRVLNADIGKELGIRQGTVFNYITGLITSLIVMLILREPFVPLPTHNLLLYTGGMIGVAVVMLSNYAAPKLSVFLMTLLVFVSQFATALIIDGLSGLPLSWLKALGGAFVLGGLAVHVIGEKKRQEAVAQ